MSLKSSNNFSELKGKCNKQMALQLSVGSTLIVQFRQNFHTKLQMVFARTSDVINIKDESEWKKNNPFQINIPADKSDVIIIKIKDKVDVRIASESKLNKYLPIALNGFRKNNEHDTEIVVYMCPRKLYTCKICPKGKLSF